MPNYVLSRTSPPTNIYERKIDLGYGIKVDTSDAPTPEPKKEKNMNDVNTTKDVADQLVDTQSVFVQSEDYPNADAKLIREHLKAKEAEEAKEVTVD